MISYYMTIMMMVNNQRCYIYCLADKPELFRIHTFFVMTIIGYKTQQTNHQTSNFIFITKKYSTLNNIDLEV